MGKKGLIKLNKIRKIRHHARIDVLRAENPALEALFLQLHTATAPNFLDIMAAISEIATLFPEHDSSSCVPQEDENRGYPVSSYPTEQSRCPDC